MLNWNEIRLSAQSWKGMHTLTELEEWSADIRQRTFVKVDNKPLHDLNGWLLNEHGQIIHNSGKFFSITGFRTVHEGVVPKTWDQPAINQREIGILGFLCCKINGIYHFLVQAKIEPGNINSVQLSPTVQATRSNFTQVHNGKPVKYLSYFMGGRSVVDRLQSEQGGRFYRKVNRNVIVFTDDYVDEEVGFKWMTLGQIYHFLQQENVVNMDTRTVLANLMALDPLCNRSPRSLNKLSHERFKNHFLVSELPLSRMQDWGSFDGTIGRMDQKFFSIIGASVQIEGREVSSWDQPMIKPASPGICGLLVKPTPTSVSALVQYKFEFGLYQGVELAPTVQSLLGGKQLALDNQVPYIEFFKDKNEDNQTLYSAMQSEEGGRFFREENSNQIVKISSDSIYQNHSYDWVSLEDLMGMITLGGCVNIQLRNLALVLWLNGLMK